MNPGITKAMVDIEDDIKSLFEHIEEDELRI